MQDANLDTYSKLIRLLDESGAPYRLLDHPPEGRTDIVSQFRGHHPSQAAKCIIVMLKLGKKETKYILAVVPGDRRLDLQALKALFAATYITFASAEIAERLAGSPAGTILPFVMNPDVELIVDPSLRELSVLYFNAARLDRSIALNTGDYLAIAKPRFAAIAAPPAGHDL
jgi:Ala-tRNA(Pro) deacylase